jgi:hypothetical protein
MFSLFLKCSLSLFFQRFFFNGQCGSSKTPHLTWPALLWKKARTGPGLQKRQAYKNGKRCVLKLELLISIEQKPKKKKRNKEEKKRQQLVALV